MADRTYTYVIVGGGLAGVSAARAIREHDTEGSIVLIGDEKHPPYHRPPLTKSLWTGTKKVENIFVEDSTFFEDNRIELRLGARVGKLDCQRGILTDYTGAETGYEKLLLATGGAPRQLPVSGGNLEGVCYYRYLDDYHEMRSEVQSGRSAMVIGGGFIGSEIAAGLVQNDIRTTMLFRDSYVCARVFPAGLGKAVNDMYRSQGVELITEDMPETIQKESGHFITTTRRGARYETDMLIVGIGIEPETALALEGGLETESGILLNERLQTSNPQIYAAGDNASVPYAALGGRRRIEHWDCALSQGAHAGRNMVGADEPFTYLPYFFSDLFDFGYEAVGDIDPKLDVFADWQAENEKGIVYYHDGGKVRGVLLCNVFEKLDQARALIRSGRQMTTDDLRGAIS